MARTRLGSAGFGEPETLVTADGVTHGKPDPEPYRRALDILGVEASQAVAVEDSVKGATSARPAGLFVVGLDPRGADRALDTVTDLVVRSLDEVSLRW